MPCLNCEGPLTSRFSVKFCSRSCSVKFNNRLRVRSKESRGKTADSINHWNERVGRAKASIICENERCGQSFMPARASRRFCSKKCWFESRSSSQPGKISSRTIQKMFRRAFPNWHCPFCSWSLTVNVHHIIERNAGGTHDTMNLVGLCPNHHSLVHSDQMDDADLAKLPDLAIGNHYSNEEFAKFYYGSSENGWQHHK